MSKALSLVKVRNLEGTRYCIVEDTLDRSRGTPARYANIYVDEDTSQGWYTKKDALEAAKKNGIKPANSDGTVKAIQVITVNEARELIYNKVGHGNYYFYSVKSGPVTEGVNEAGVEGQGGNNMALGITVSGNNGFIGYPDKTVRIIMSLAGIADLSRVKGMVVEVRATKRDVRVVQVTIKKSWSKEWRPEWNEYLEASRFKKSGSTWVAKVNLEDQQQPYEIRVLDKMEKYNPGEDSAPKAETQIKVSGESAKVLRDFVNRNLEELNSNHKITTFFIDTEEEYKKYNVQIPGICLVVADKRASKASLKKEPVVIRFDKSKTLKRYSDWKKGSVPGINGEVWYTIYVSAAEARNNGVKSLSVETDTMTKIGYLDEEGSLVCTPARGRTVALNGKAFLVGGVDGQYVNILNEESGYYVNELDLDESVVELDNCSELGKVCGGMVCIGKLDEALVYADDSDNVYLNEAMTDKLESCMVYRSRKNNSPIVTGEVREDSDVVRYWNTDGDSFSIKKSEFPKKFKAGKLSDFNLFDEEW